MNKNIIIDYYQGAYGPTLRIDVISVDDLNRLKNLFVNLSKSSAYTVDLTKLEQSVMVGLNNFLLQSSSKVSEKNKKTLTQVKGSNDVSFLWEMSPNDWEQIVCLTQRLIDINSPGHQYLTQEGLDDALIELAFLERRDSGSAQSPIL